MKRRVLCFAISSLVAMSGFAQKYPFLDEKLPIEQRVEDLLGRMTLEEKIAIIHAQSKFSSPGIQRLGVPDLWCTDGPHGIRPEVKWDQWDQAGWTNDSIVAFPALTCLASTWNVDMGRLYGVSIGEEARYRKKDVILGPGVNIFRTPLGGRNFEYMGEDPYLSGKMAVQYIKGVQSNGVATCVKHFCLNNQERNRHGVNVHVDDRALYEIYLPAFKMAVLEGDSWTLMAAYNLIDGQHAGHNYRTLQQILKGEWGYKGAVVSDWGGTHNTDEAVRNGLDLEFGTGTNGLSGRAKKSYDNYYLALPFLEGIESGKYSMADLDDKVRRVLRLHMLTTLNTHKPFGCTNSEEHYAAARQIGAEGIVLLKNDNNILPLKAEGKKILMVGENAVKMMTVGGGSSSLKVQREINPLQGMQARYAGKADVKWARGYVGDISGNYNGVTTGQNLADDRSFKELVTEAVAEAKKADYVIFVGGLNKSGGQDCEGCDRQQYGLPYKQDSLITELAKANPNFVVVNISGTAVEMPWADKVPAIVQGWYLGSETGNALAQILSGDVTPSGKLPFTWPKKLSDVPAHKLDAYSDKDEYYKESIFVGYRWADKQKDVKPLFPFGHGLSYTTFEYAKPEVDKTVISENDSITVSVKVRNTGKVAGKEIVQLYISDKKSSLPRPIKELKGFKKIALNPGEEKSVSFTLGKDALSYFDDKKHEWVAEPGKFEAVVAASAQDIRGKVGFELK
jgi:beta-glucosidase